MNKIKSFGFWSALAGAVVVLLNSISKAFGFDIQSELVSDIIMAVAGVLVVLGIVTMPQKDDKKEDSEEEKDEKNNKN